MKSSTQSNQHGLLSIALNKWEFYHKCNFLVSRALHCISLWTWSIMMLQNCSKSGSIRRKSTLVFVKSCIGCYVSLVVTFSCNYIEEEHSGEFPGCSRQWQGMWIPQGCFSTDQLLIVPPPLYLLIYPVLPLTAEVTNVDPNSSHPWLTWSLKTNTINSYLCRLDNKSLLLLFFNTLF